MSLYDLAIIGAGSSGLYLACVCHSLVPDMNIVILDSNPKLGRKLAITGNGRCNLTNNTLNIDEYFTDDPDKLKAVIGAHDQYASISFFENELGLDTKDKGELVYPSTFKSASVIDAMRLYLQDVDIRLDSKVLGIRKEDNFILKTSASEITSKKVAVCTGGCSYKVTGSDGNFFKVLGSLIPKERFTAVNPALVSLVSSDKDIRDLSGQRFECTVTLENNGNKIKTETGEMLFTDYGISGICVMQLSRFLKPGKNVVVADLTDSDEHIRKCIEKFNDRKIEDALAGVLPRELTRIALKRLSKDQLRNDSDVKRFLDLLHNFRIIISVTNGFDNAQVTRGGLKLSALDEHLQSLDVPGLFVAGEAVNVDGPCGGYNLQWAWSSAYAVAKGVIG